MTEAEAALVEVTARNANELIQRLTAENERLKREAATLDGMIEQRDSQITTIEGEIERLKADLTAGQIQRDKEFWRQYADQTCRELEDSNSKFAHECGNLQRQLTTAREAIEKLHTMSLQARNVIHKDMVKHVTTDVLAKIGRA